MAKKQVSPAFLPFVRLWTTVHKDAREGKKKRRVVGGSSSNPV